MDSPNALGLYSLDQVQTLSVGTPLLARDAVINGNGEMEFQFTSPDNAVFFRIESR